MNISFPYSIKLQFPGDLDYVPPIRKFIAEILEVSNFSSKFAYRTEIIVDEICSNAVTYGCQDDNSMIELSCAVSENKIDFMIKDQGGNKENISRLKSVLEHTNENTEQKQGLGIEIVRMLSENLDYSIDENNVTSVHVTRKRENS